MSEKPGYTDLETVFVGPYAQALTLQASLAAAGLQTFLPDQMMKAIDPFITGANPLGAKLLAPTAYAKETREAIEQWRTQNTNSSTLENDEEETAVDPIEESLVSMGKKIWFCALFGITAPLGLYWAFRYAKLLPMAKNKPPQFWIAIAGIAVSGLMFLAVYVIPPYLILRRI